MSDDAAPILHATTVADWREGAWAGVMLRGPSGAGKSDMALRLLARGWRLVADDRTLVWRSGARLFARAPAVLAGRIEARGLGVLTVPVLPSAPVALVIDAVPPGAEPERVPEPARVTLLGLGLPCVTLSLLEASAPDKVSLALAQGLRWL